MEEISEPSKEFLEQKRILEMRAELEAQKHKYKLEELQLERENARILHEKQLEFIRIKMAEQRKLNTQRGLR